MKEMKMTNHLISRNEFETWQKTNLKVINELFKHPFQDIDYAGPRIYFTLDEERYKSLGIIFDNETGKVMIPGLYSFFYRNKTEGQIVKIAKTITQELSKFGANLFI